MARARVESRAKEALVSGQRDLIQQATDLMQLDPDGLDPDSHYRWVHPRNFGRRKMQGYEVVLRSESGIRFMHEDERINPAADDLLRRGESVLMACKKEVYRERVRRINQLAQARLSHNEEAFAERVRVKGKGRGITPLVDNEGDD